MTLLLEINDIGLRCYQDGQLLHQSPGIAVAEKHLLLGDEAWQQSRLHPLNTHADFWSQLNTTAISSQHPKVRHNGDLAYLHLQHIESELGISFNHQDVIYALPSSMDRNALGLLLGISQQCGLNPIGLVDQALAAMLPHADQQQVWFLDMHLNESLLTRLNLSNGTLTRENTESFNAQGWLQIHNKVLQFLADEFIRNTRFNPRHNAGIEQRLFNSIPDLLRQSLTAPSIQCELEGNELKIDSQALRQVLQAAVPAITDQLMTLSNLYLSDRLGQWQPLLANQSKAVGLSQSQHISAMSLLSKHIDAHPEGVRFVSSLPSQHQSKTNGRAETPSPASHFVWRHRAYPLNGHYTISRDGELQPSRSPIAASAAVSIQQGKVQAGSAKLKHNQRPMTSAESFQLGDQLHIEGLEDSMVMIGVES